VADAALHQDGALTTETVLITGASTGIGAELARLFAKDGARLVLVARDREKLAQLAQRLESESRAQVLVISQDLAGIDGVDALMVELRDAPIDVLVNNAGVGVYGPFAATDLAAERRMIQLNVAALTELTKRCLPGMLERRRGRILNVASTAAFQPGPLMAVYYATKAYVLSFSEALANELSGSGITVTALCPGPTLTEFQRRAGTGRLRLFGFGIMDAAVVARAGYDGLRRGRRIVIPGLVNRLAVSLVRVTPRRLVTAVVRALQERREGG